MNSLGPLTLFLIAASINWGCAQETTESEGPTSSILFATVELETRSGGAGLYHYGVVTTDPLKCDTEYLLQLKIINSSDEPLEFDGVSTGCKCRKFEVETGTIEVGKTAEARLRFTTPKDLNGEWNYFGVELRKSGNTVASIPCRSRLIANMKLMLEQVVIDNDSGGGFQSVPFVYSSPISMASLKVEIDHDLKEVLEVSMKSDQPGKGVLYIAADKDLSLDGETLAGKIRLVDSANDISKEFSIIVRDRPPFSVHPAFLKFSKRQTPAESNYEKLNLEASAILRISDELGSDAVRVKVSGRVSNQDADIKVTKLASGIYRLRVFSSEDAFSKNAQDDFFWFIEIGRQEYEFSSHCAK